MFLLLFAGSYGIGLMADKSKSLVIAALFHSLSNLMQNQLLAEIDFSYKLIIIIVSGVLAYFIVKNSKKSFTKNAKIQLT